MAYIQLHCFKKVYKKLQFKEHLLYKQSLKELKAKEQKEINSIKVKSLAASVTYQLPLANSFKFNFFFLILPNVTFSSTPLPFL